jgi:DNA-binding IclR family transcriptional regulator
VILAYLDKEETATSKNSVTDEETSSEELQRIRTDGFCLDTGIPEEGIVSLAVPLLRTGAVLSGALCMVAPEYRLTPVKIRSELLPHLKEAGEVISSRLGYLGHYL